VLFPNHLRHLSHCGIKDVVEAVVIALARQLLALRPNRPPSE